MKIVTKTTDTQFIPIPISKKGASLLLTEPVYKRDGTGVYAYLTNEHWLPHALPLWLREELLYYATVEVSKEEDREPTLEELAELALLYYAQLKPSIAHTDYVKYLNGKYPDFFYTKFFSILESRLIKENAAFKCNEYPLRELV